MLIEKFSKSAGPILESKEHFFQNNSELRESLLAQNEIYTAQPRRTRCKNCDALLPKEPERHFVKHGVAYVLCGLCSHLNGVHEDSEEFCKKIYVEDDGKTYGKNYQSEDKSQYWERVHSIYLPKALFLKEVLSNSGADFAQLSCTDFGSGSGYFVGAMQKALCGSAFGFDVSRSQIDLGNHFLGDGSLFCKTPEEMASMCPEVTSKLISFIGVLEHLREPRLVLNQVCANRHIDYLFISVPLFSFSVFLEAVFPRIMPRQLAGAHTHLFTPASLEYMEEEFHLHPLGKWWFGTDVIDLYRSLSVSLSNDSDTRELQPIVTKHFKEYLDELQGVIDRSRLCSEVHAVYQIRR